MKMVKSLLLGSAAGLIAVTAGQAADLPVKAKPVEYVKICSLYGAGFYYMPGTDLCIKVGGWVRAEAAYGGINGSMTWGPYAGAANLRTTTNFAERARGYITADVRNQTEYGTVRAYIAVGINTNDVGTTVGNSAASNAFVFSGNRAFVQWAGMTAGLSQSFYDFYSVPAMQYRGGYLPASDTGDGGWWVWAYTAQFGGGVSASISAETRRMTQIIDQNCAATGFTTTPTCGGLTPGSFPNLVTANGNTLSTAANIYNGFGAYGGYQTPDIVANIRVDQAWGGAQLAGALHEVNASYYSTVAGGAAPNPNQLGHPSDAWGWAISAGLKVNTPFITQGDWFQAQFNVTQGALRYLFNTPDTNWGATNNTSGTGVVDGTESYGVLSDCVYGGSTLAANGTSCQLTSAWGFNAGYEHYWTPAWHTSLYGAWYAVSYGAAANAMLCSAEGGGNGAGIGSASVATAGCNNNWSTWGIGSRTQWDVTKTFYLGLEVLYSDLHSAQTFNGLIAGTTAIAGATAGVTTVKNDTSSWMVSVRAHRDFLP